MSRSELNATGADGVLSEANRVIAKQADTRKANRFQAANLAFLERT